MYNGFRNYETWATNLWFSNDPGLESIIREYANDVEYNVSSIAVYLKNVFEELLEEENEFRFGLFSDLLQSAIENIDWIEIAETWVEESEEGE